MGFFSKVNNGSGSQHLNSDEYDKILKRLSEIDSRLAAVENNNGLLSTSLATLRGMFNRKISGLKEEKPEEENTSSEGYKYFG